ncbi:unnamed protein product, partial [marine sediment metagenome]
VIRREGGYAYVDIAEIALRTHGQTFIDFVHRYTTEEWTTFT